MPATPTDVPQERSSQSPIEEAQRTLKRYLKTHSLRATTERRVVLEHAYTMKHPFSVEELRIDVEQANMSLSAATVYNCLELFVKIGLVVQVPWKGRMRYERVLGEPPVHALQRCTACNTIERLDGSEIEASLERVPFVRFKPQVTVVCSTGLCSKCRAAETRLRNNYLREHWWEEDEF